MIMINDYMQLKLGEKKLYTFGGNVQPLWDISWRLFKKQSTSYHISEGSEVTLLKRHLHQHDHCSIIYSS